MTWAAARLPAIMSAHPPRQPSVSAPERILLIGGSNDTISLQPLSVQGQEGLNAALAVAGLALRPA